MAKIYARKGEYITTVGGVKVLRILEDVYFGDPIKAEQIESVDRRIPTPKNGYKIPTDLNGDPFFDNAANGPSFHFKDGWR